MRKLGAVLVFGLGIFLAVALPIFLSELLKIDPGKQPALLAGMIPGIGLIYLARQLWSKPTSETPTGTVLPEVPETSNELKPAITPESADESPVSSVLPDVVFELAPKRYRLNLAIGLLAPLLMIFAIIKGWERAKTGEQAVLGFSVLIVLISLLSILFRPRVIVRGDRFELHGLSTLHSPVSNLKTVAHDRSLVVTFHDVALVSNKAGPLKKAEQKRMLEDYARDKCHTSLPSFSLAQVEEVRQKLGLPAPSPEDPTGQAEQFHRNLLSKSPRVFVTYLLLGINCLIFAMMMLAGASPLNPELQQMIDWGADFGPRTARGEWWRLFTCTFLHFGVVHLVVNMGALLNAGGLAERLLGSTRFLLMYLLAGLLGSLASLYWNPVLVSAGASGSIFGVFGAILGLVLLNRQTIPPEIVRRIRKGGLIFLGINFLVGLSDKKIDLAAHLGGFAVGTLIGLFFANADQSENRSRRMWRTALLALVGFSALAFGIAAFPPIDNHFSIVIREFPDIEKKVLDRYNSSLTLVNEGKIAPREFADIMEKEVLPPWKDMQRRLSEASFVQGEHSKIRPVLLDYLSAREKAWELQIRAIREENRDLSIEAQRWAYTADLHVEKLNKMNK